MKNLIEYLALANPNCLITVAFRNYPAARLAFKAINFLDVVIQSSDNIIRFPNDAVIEFKAFEDCFSTKGLHRNFLVLTEELLYKDEIIWNLKIRTQTAVIEYYNR